jgi:hypothetical protein
MHHELKIDQMAWQKRGACVNATAAISNLFTNHERKVRDPDPRCIALCRVCVVQTQCLDFGMTQADGVWGATTPYMRKQLGKVQHRVYCPGCGGNEVYLVGTGEEICIECGLSWFA